MTTTYQAFEVQGYGSGGLTQVTRRSRPLEAHEVRIAVRSAAVNYRDRVLIEGSYLPEMARPWVPLSEGAGDVIEVGSRVPDLAVGDAVLGHYTSAWLAGPFREDYHASKIGGPLDGWLAQEIILPYTALLRVPPGWDYAEAGALAIAGVTAWHALGDIAALNNKRVLIEGSGNVSLQVLQLAVAAGAETLVLTSSEKKRAVLEALGAQAVIGPGDHEYRRRTILEQSSGHGVDLAVDVVGGALLSEVVLPVMAYNGEVVIVGFLDSGRFEEDLAGPLLKRLLHLRGISVGSRAHMEALLSFMTRHGLRPQIAQRYGLGDARKAIFGAEPEVPGKRVIEIG